MPVCVLTHTDEISGRFSQYDLNDNLEKQGINWNILKYMNMKNDLFFQSVCKYVIKFLFVKRNDFNGHVNITELLVLQMNLFLHQKLAKSALVEGSMIFW